jgi:hypothetical protein
VSLPDHIGSLQALPESLVIAVDTEFDDTHTLTVQAAARLDEGTLAVQVYRSAAIPNTPEGFDLHGYLPLTHQGYGRFCERIVVRSVQPLTPRLSPLRMACDLLGLSSMGILSRRDNEERLDTFRPEPTHQWWSVPPENIRWDSRRKRWKIPALNLTLVGHYLRVDYGRLFGWQFIDELRNLQLYGRPRIAIEGRKLLRFIEQRGRYRDTRPILEYAYLGQNYYEVHVEMRDTMLPFGPASLDRLSQTFLGLRKSDTLSEEDKRNMFRTFQTRTADAYGYAMTDVVNTLLIYEQMIVKDREIYESFGLRSDIPPLRPFLGGRVSTFFLATTRTSVAAGSTQLASQQSLRTLMRKGGVAQFEDNPDASKFGRQTGQVHGGLLLNRAPTKLWHEAEGMLADVDMSNCYVENASRINAYWGRPVVLEPGGRRTTVAQAVAMVSELAPNDGWMLFASGTIHGFPNVLIPSTEDAITGASYQDRARRKRLASARQALQLEAESDPGGYQGLQGTKLYTAQVDFGVVTYPVWLMIQALPPRSDSSTKNWSSRACSSTPSP